MPHQCTNCGRVFPDGSKEMLSGCPDCGGNKFQFQPSSPSRVTDSGGSSDAANPDAASGSTAGRVGSGRRLDAGADARDVTADAAGGTVAGDTPRENHGSDAVEDAIDQMRDLIDDRGASEDDPIAADEDRGSSPIEPDNRDRGWPTHGKTDPGEETVDTGENAAQADARSDVVPPDELPDAPDRESAPGNRPPETEGSAREAPDAGDRSGIGRIDDGPDLEQLRAELNEQFESIRIVSPGQYELNLMELYDREEYIISLMEDGRYAIEVPEAWRDD